MIHGLYCARSKHINCAHCHGSHHTVAQVRVCGLGIYIDPETGEQREAAPCTWLIETTTEEGFPSARECGHPMWQTARGSTCAAGHEDVTCEVRAQEGWDYASDTGEAYALAGAGIEPRHTDGKLWV